MGRIRQRLARKASRMEWVPCSVPEPVFAMIAEAEKGSPLKCPPQKYFGNWDCTWLKAGCGRPLHCEQNVAAFIAKNPGCTAQKGEVLWWNPQNGDITREAHVVVRMPEGGLLDVTSYFGGDEQICFIPKD